MVPVAKYSEAVIGFIETNYPVLEANGFVTLVFGVIEGGVQEGVEVRLTLSSGSAEGMYRDHELSRLVCVLNYSPCYSAGADYIDVDDVFTFDPTTTTIEYNVTLIDDDIYEFDEGFSAQLSFVSPVERVSIDPAFADVVIEDEDGTN